MQDKFVNLCNPNPVTKPSSYKGSKMNSLTILTVVGICVAIYAAFRLGQESGYSSGMIDGRRAVRNYYEQVGR